MISNTAVSANGVGGYHFKEDGQEAPGHWLGKGAKQLQLDGEVDKKDFNSVARGLAPNGIPLKLKRSRFEDGLKFNAHRAGTDSMFAPPKPVSILGLVGKDKRVVEAHQHAVKATLKEVEETCSVAKIRTGGRRRNEITGSMIIAAFEHSTTRPDKEGISDPQIHTHAIIFNSTKCKDGKWRSLENWKFYRKDKRRLRRFYIKELGNNLRDIGYKLVPGKENLTFSIEGVSREQELAYSRRAKEIGNELGTTTKGTGFIAARIAALKTRLQKESVGQERLDEHWEKVASEHGLDFDNIPGYVRTPDTVEIGLKDKLQLKVLEVVGPIQQQIQKQIAERIQKPIELVQENYQKTFGYVTEEEYNAITNEEAVEWLRPSHISSEDWKELVIDSAINPAIATRSFETVDGDDAKELVIGHALSKVGAHGQQHATKEVQGILETYKTLEDGGLWCRGTGEWGELKAKTQRLRAKKGRDGKYKTDKDSIPIKEPVKYDPVYKMPKGITLPQSNEWSWDAIRNNPKVEIGITEGAKKAASTSSQGLPTIGIAGLTGGVKDGELNHELKKFNWKGRKVYLVLDKDPASKTAVLRNASIELFKMAALLENKGAIVTIGTIPGELDQKVGLDDHFVAGGNLNDLRWESLNSFCSSSPYLPQKYKKMNARRIELSLGNAIELETAKVPTDRTPDIAKGLPKSERSNLPINGKATKQAPSTEKDKKEIKKAEKASRTPAQAKVPTRKRPIRKKRKAEKDKDRGFDR